MWKELPKCCVSPKCLSRLHLPHFRGPLSTSSSLGAEVRPVRDAAQGCPTAGRLPRPRPRGRCRRAPGASDPHRIVAVDPGGHEQTRLAPAPLPRVGLREPAPQAPNATRQARPMAGARDERRLLGVACTRLFGAPLRNEKPSRAQILLCLQGNLD